LTGGHNRKQQELIYSAKTERKNNYREWRPARSLMRGLT